MGVEATNVGALDGLVESAVTAFVDGAELIHEHVVSNIAPAQVLCVVFVGSANLRGGLCRGVVIGARGVVQRHRLDAVIVGGLLAALGFIGAPSGARNYLWHAIGGGSRFDGLAFLGIAVHEDGI